MTPKFKFGKSYQTAGPIDTKFGTHVHIHLGMDIYAKQIEPQDKRSHFGGFKVSHIQKSGRLSNGWTDWHQIWYTSADSSGNGHRLNTILPSTMAGRFRGSQIQKSGEDVKKAGPIGTKFGTHNYAIHLGMDRRQTNWPERHKGALGGF